MSTPIKWRHAPRDHTHSYSDFTGLQDALDEKVGTNDPRLTDARTPTAHSHAQSDVTGLGTTLAGKRNVEAIELNPGADANDLVTPGVYIETYSFEATGNLNFPENADGVLKVESSSNRVRVEQSWRGTSSGNRFERSRNSGTWTPWQRLTPYSSGLRDVSTLIVAGWTGGVVRIWRVGSTVNISASGMTRAENATGLETALTLPSGWRPPAQASGYTWRGKNCRVLTNGSVQVYAPGMSTDDFSFSYSTLEPPPAIPTGSAG